MFMNCPYCGALVATDPATDAPPERCPRCAVALRKPGEATAPPQAAATAVPPPMPMPPASDVVAIQPEALAQEIATVLGVEESAWQPLGDPAPSFPVEALPAVEIDTDARDAAPPSQEAEADRIPEPQNDGEGEAAVAIRDADAAAGEGSMAAPTAAPEAAGSPEVAPATVPADAPDPGVKGPTEPGGEAAGPPETTPEAAADIESDAGKRSPQLADAGSPTPRLVRATGKSTPSFVRASGTRARGHGVRGWRAPAAIASLVVLLALQLLLADRAQLAERARWRPWITSLCNVLHCTVPAWREAQAFTLVERDVRPHPTMPGALRVTASFRNDARWPQPWPRLALTLSDIDGREAGTRSFSAMEYLGAAPTQAQLDSGQVASIAMDVVEPAPRIVAFTFEFQ